MNRCDPNGCAMVTWLIHRSPTRAAEWRYDHLHSYDPALFTGLLGAGVCLRYDLDKHITLTDAAFVRFVEPCVHEITEFTCEKRPSGISVLAHGTEYSAPNRLDLLLDRRSLLRFVLNKSR